MPSFLERHLPVHVEVAREAGGDQVLGPVLDPLHRPAEQQRRGGRHDVARVHRHLVAESAADVRREDPDVLLRQARDQREHGADRVRGLGRHVDRHLAGAHVHVGEAAARLQRRRMHAGVVGVQRDDRLSSGERRVGRVLVAVLPVVDVVIGLPFLLVADHGRAGFHRLLRRDDGRQRVVVHVDQLERVDRRVGVLGDDRRDLLSLEPHLVGGQDRLCVAGERRHPGQVVLGHQLAGDHRDDAGCGRRAGGVDRVDLRMGVRAAEDRHVQHPRQDDVVDVVALAADEPVVLLAADAVADPADLLWLGRHRSSFSFRMRCGYADATAGCSAFAAAAARIAATMLM